MRGRVFLATLLAIVVVGLPGGYWMQRARVARSLEAEQKGWFPYGAIDLGEIVHRSQHEIESMVCNPLDRTVDVFAVDSSCGCIATSIEPGPLAPGECRRFTATVVAKDTIGSFRRTLRILSASRRRAVGRARSSGH